MRRLLVLSAIVLLPVSQTFAWSDAGHKITASIAFRCLSPAEQKAVVKILKQHPRFQEDFQSKVPDDVDDETYNEWVFQQAAVWPDMARSFQGDAAQYHHPQWHYINVPAYLAQVDEDALKGQIEVNLSTDTPDQPRNDLNIVQVIRMARRTLKDDSVTNAEKAVMLCWLLHTVGDLHQPLHSTAMFSRKLFKTGDKGGNAIRTTQRGNLHAVWDQFPGGKIQFRTARNRAVQLFNDQRDEGQLAAGQLDEQKWLAESHTIAITTAYDPEVQAQLRQMEASDDIEIEPIELSPNYLAAGGKAAEKRLVQGGYRLGAVLKGIID